MNKRLPPTKFLCECFVYNQDAGELYWKVRPRKHFSTDRAASTWNARFARSRAGRVLQCGYYAVAILGVQYVLHRIIWKLVTGKEPPKSIDHIDGDRTNNCFSNLRLAIKTEQAWNASLSKANKSGYRGVVSHYGKWQARIVVNYATQCLGNFDTTEEAAATYQAVARKIHGEFYREDAP